MIGFVWFEVNIPPWNNTVTYVKGHTIVMQFVFTAKMLITYFQRVSGYLQYIFSIFLLPYFRVPLESSLWLKGDTLLK